MVPPPPPPRDDNCGEVRRYVLVVRWTILGAHQVDYGEGSGEEDDLHDGVVEGGEVPEDVQVARHEHQRVHLLRLERDALTWQHGGTSEDE